MKTDISDFHNTQSGRCWIVGNGSSLNSTPLEEIQEPTFGMNSIHLICDKTTWRPTYYTNFKRKGSIEVIQKTIQPVLELGVPCIVNSRYAPVNVESWFPKGYFDNLYALSYAHIDFRNPNEFDWMENPYWVFGYGTGTYASCQIACWMGFEEIIFVGHDMNWRGWDISGDTNHFAKNYSEGFSEPLNEEQAFHIGKRMLTSHEAIKARCEERGVKVFNATIGGELEVYPRVDFYEVCHSGNK